MSPLIPTANGNGPYIPVLVYKRERYVVGSAFERLEDAIEQATLIAVGIRDQMRWKDPEE